MHLLTPLHKAGQVLLKEKKLFLEYDIADSFSNLGILGNGRVNFIPQNKQHN